MVRDVQMPESEVWLRANTRPVSLLVATSLLTGSMLVALCGLSVVARFAVPAAIGYWLVAGPLVTAVALTAARPRLTYRGGKLRVRLKPLVVYDVPLECVECFFMGSEKLAGRHAGDDEAGHRVSTLVMRIAERATTWQARPTLTAWGTWADGSVVFDGRWCEPLSIDLARRLSARLVETKRAGLESEACA